VKTVTMKITMTVDDPHSELPRGFDKKLAERVRNVLTEAIEQENPVLTEKLYPDYEFYLVRATVNHQ
jgi:hypothetical protein